MPSNRIHAISDSIFTIHNQPSRTTTLPNNTTDNIPDTFDDSDDNLCDAPSPSTLEDSEIAALQRSTYVRSNQFDYKKFFQKEKVAAVKTNSSIPLNFLHSKASCILFDQTLNYLR